MKNLFKGQMGELTTREGEDASWEYVVVLNNYDDRTEFLKENGGRYMHVWSDDISEDESIALKDQKTKLALTMLKKDGNDVKSKRSLFGRYKFKPKQI